MTITTQTIPTNPKAKKEPKVEHSSETPRILVPENLSFGEAATYCTKKAQEEEAIAPVVRAFRCLPWAGAYATERVLDSEFSAVGVKTTEILVPAAGGRQRKIRWGTWEVAGLGTVEQGVNFGTDSIEYIVVVKCKRKDAPRAEALHDRIEAEIEKRELYSGCAVMLEPNNEGKLYLERPPKVVDLEKINPSDVVLEDSLSASVRAELFMPITHSERVARAGVPIRRGVLLAGRPGTGKTMSARVAARLAIDKGWTAFYLPDARAVEGALRIAAAHQPAVLICEDLDRQLGGERNAETDRILNALDGLDRSAKVIFIATTNDPDSLPAPLLRPGRMDTLLFFGLPDAQAALRLLNKYLGDRRLLDPADGERAATACAGLLPASIREVASRSILHAMNRNATDSFTINADDVVEAAISVHQQQRKLEDAEKVKAHLPAMRVFTHSNATQEEMVAAAIAMRGMDAKADSIDD